jgi:cytochrome c oxidase subunit IV
MEHTMESLTHEQHAGGGKKEIFKVTWILSILTLIELVLGFYMIGMEDGTWRMFIKGVIVILMLAKAAYIVGYFMHLKHELRNFILTIIVPLFLFVWFIIAFLADGNSYKNLKNTYDRHHYEKSQEKAQPVEQHNGHDGEHSGAAE